MKEKIRFLDIFGRCKFHAKQRPFHAKQCTFHAKQCTFHGLSMVCPWSNFLKYKSHNSYSAQVFPSIFDCGDLYCNCGHLSSRPGQDAKKRPLWVKKHPFYKGCLRNVRGSLGYIYGCICHMLQYKETSQEKKLLTTGAEKTQPLKRPFWFHCNLICPVCVCVSMRFIWGMTERYTPNWERKYIPMHYIDVWSLVETGRLVLQQHFDTYCNNIWTIPLVSLTFCAQIHLLFAQIISKLSGRLRR